MTNLSNLSKPNVCFACSSRIRSSKIYREVRAVTYCPDDGTAVLPIKIPGQVEPSRAYCPPSSPYRRHSTLRAVLRGRCRDLPETGQGSFSFLKETLFHRLSAGVVIIFRVNEATAESVACTGAVSGHFPLGTDPHFLKILEMYSGTHTVCPPLARIILSGLIK